MNDDVQNTVNEAPVEEAPVEEARVEEARVEHAEEHDSDVGSRSSSEAPKGSEGGQTSDDNDLSTEDQPAVTPEEGELEAEEQMPEEDDAPEAEVVQFDLNAEQGDAAVEDHTPDEVNISRIESLIFVSPEPLSVRKLAKILSLEGKHVRELLNALAEQYAGRGIQLDEVAGGFQFRSNPINAPVIQHIFKVKPLRLSRSALETLAIVAYRQPLTRAEVEDIRGVDSGGTLKYLFEKQLVRVLGRREGPGRPIIYGSTPDFLALFGLKALGDFPPLHEFSDLWDEHKELVDEETPLSESDNQPVPENVAPTGEPEHIDETPDETTDDAHSSSEAPEGSEGGQTSDENESSEPAEPAQPVQQSEHEDNEGEEGLDHDD